MRYNLMTAILTWSAFVILMSMFVTIPLTPIFVEDLSINENEAAWISSIYSLCFALGCLIYGPLSDKFGRKIFLVSGVSVLAVITFITGFVEHYELLLVMRAIQGLAASAFAPLSLVYASEMFPPQRRLTVTGFITFGFLIAAVIAQVFGIIVSIYFEWTAIFLILGILYFITSLLVLFYLPKGPILDEESNLLRRYIQIKDLFKNRKLCISFFIMFTLYFTLMGMYTMLGSYLQSEPFNFTEATILSIRALGIISMFTSMFAGKMANKFGVLRLLRVSLALAGISLLLMSFSHSLYAIVLSSLLFVAGIACVVPINVSLVVKNSGIARGSAVLFNAFSLFLGASIGPVLATRLIQGGNYLLAFVLFSSFLFISLIISIFLIKKSLKTPY